MVFLKVKEIRQGSTITLVGLYRRKTNEKTTVSKQRRSGMQRMKRWNIQLRYHPTKSFTEKLYRLFLC